MAQPDFVDTKEAARLLSISPRTLERWRVTGEGPRFRKLGRAVRYAIADLERFVDVAARESTRTSAQAAGKREA